MGRLVKFIWIVSLALHDLTWSLEQSEQAGGNCCNTSWWTSKEHASRGYTSGWCERNCYHETDDQCSQKNPICEEGSDHQICVCENEHEEVEIPEDCVLWFDGCNTCTRGSSDEVFACTLIFCEVPGKPECLQFEETQQLQEIPENCAIWFDGCNTCTKDDNGQYICTEMACESWGMPECIEFEDNCCHTGWWTPKEYEERGYTSEWCDMSCVHENDEGCWDYNPVCEDHAPHQICFCKEPERPYKPEYRSEDDNCCYTGWWTSHENKERGYTPEWCHESCVHKDDEGCWDYNPACEDGTEGQVCFCKGYYREPHYMPVYPEEYYEGHPIYKPPKVPEKDDNCCHTGWWTPDEFFDRGYTPEWCEMSCVHENDDGCWDPNPVCEDHNPHQICFCKEPTYYYEPEHRPEDDNCCYTGWWTPDDMKERGYTSEWCEESCVHESDEGCWDPNPVCEDHFKGQICFCKGNYKDPYYAPVYPEEYYEGYGNMPGYVQSGSTGPENNEVAQISSTEQHQGDNCCNTGWWTPDEYAEREYTSEWCDKSCYHESDGCWDWNPACEDHNPHQICFCKEPQYVYEPEDKPEDDNCCHTGWWSRDDMRERGYTSEWCEESCVHEDDEGCWDPNPVCEDGNQGQICFCKGHYRDPYYAPVYPEEYYEGYSGKKPEESHPPTVSYPPDVVHPPTQEHPPTHEHPPAHGHKPPQQGDNCCYNGWWTSADMHERGYTPKWCETSCAHENDEGCWDFNPVCEDGTEGQICFCKEDAHYPKPPYYGEHQEQKPEHSRDDNCCHTNWWTSKEYESRGYTSDWCGSSCFESGDLENGCWDINPACEDGNEHQICFCEPYEYYKEISHTGSECNGEPNTLRLGAPLEEIVPKESSAECCGECESNSHCTAFNYDMYEKKCFLLTGETTELHMVCGHDSKSKWISGEPKIGEKKGECANHCGGVAKSGCYCDANCHIYGDCCETRCKDCGYCLKYDNTEKREFATRPEKQIHPGVVMGTGFALGLGSALVGAFVVRFRKRRRAYTAMY